ncbi:MAG: M1 family metallopeptidase [Candidatus Obscuribacterales bacterium]|nr:M1 family metallopeptidase [Candidatus Obscuribacterales bacterium]
MKPDILLKSAFLVSSVFILGSVLTVKALNMEPGFGEALSPVFKARSLRLTTDVKPVNYKLSFTPDLEKARFDGDEDLQFTVATEQSALILNSAEEIIDDAFIVDTKTQIKISAATVAYDKTAEQVSISFKSAIAPGAYTLHCHFKGVLNDKLRGFYRSKFHDVNGEHYIATTQMEAADARRMFPCFDEPSFKATFDISCVVDKSLEVISNEAVASVAPFSPTLKRVTFATTPKMSSYLVALIVGPFVGTKAVVVEGVPIRIWSIGEKSNQLSFASAATAKLLPFYNNYFGIKYPNSKLDLIAIPDFEAGAMENLGAITFRETKLLYDDKDGSVNGQMSVTGVIAHEMAHMWFGDLVTMAWWDDLWLNEGFATWMASKAVNDIKPEWHQWDEFTDTREEALEHDSLNVSRPIHANVASAADADEMFDSITYSKGASIMRMLETFIGEDAFRDGIRLYMGRHKYGNATKNDLWQALSEASHRNIGALMKEWTEKPGFPLLSLGMLGAHSDGNLRLLQNRFVFTKAPDASKHPFDTVWQVPISLRSPQEATPPSGILLAKEDERFNEGNAAETVFLNAGGNGYYRTAYSAAHLKFLSENSSKLSVPERASLAADTWALTKAGKIEIIDFLKLAQRMQNDDNPYVQRIFIDGYYGLYHVCADSSLDSFSEFIQKQLFPLKEKFGWSGAKDDALTKDMRQILRNSVLTTLGTIGGDKPTIEEARQYFKTYLQTPEQIEGGMLAPMTVIVAFNGDGNDYEQILKLYKTAKSSEVEHRNLDALMCFRQPDLLERTLKMTLTDDIRTQDAPRLLQDGLSYRYSQKATWAFIKQHWAEINKRFPENMVRKMVKSTGDFHTEAMQSDLHDFIAKHPVAHAERSIAETYEFVQVNVQFARQTDALTKALKTFE